MFVNTRKKGLIIGSKGKTIRNIRNTCGGSLKIVFKDLPENRTEVIFSGEKWQVDKASKMVNHIISKSDMVKRIITEPINSSVAVNVYIDIAKKKNVRIFKDGKIITITGTDTNCRLYECEVKKYYRKFEQKQKTVKVKREFTFDCLLQIEETPATPPATPPAATHDEEFPTLGNIRGVNTNSVWFRKTNEVKQTMSLKQNDVKNKNSDDGDEFKYVGDWADAEDAE